MEKQHYPVEVQVNSWHTWAMAAYDRNHPQKRNFKGNSVEFWVKGGHNTQDCSAFQKLNLNERNHHVTKKCCCLTFIKLSHTAKSCKVIVKCLFAAVKDMMESCTGIFMRKSHKNILSKLRLSHQIKTNQNFSETLTTTLKKHYCKHL